MIRLGTEFEQVEGTDTNSHQFYSLSWDWYADVQVYIKSVLDLDRFWYWELLFDMEEFKAYIFLQALFVWPIYSDANLDGTVAIGEIATGDEGGFCYSIGWKTEEIGFEAKTAMKFQDCYKEIIKDVFDWQETWLGEDAKWIDECTTSDDIDIEFYEQILLLEQDEDWIGQSRSDSTLGLDEPGCIRFSSSASSYAAYFAYEYVSNLL